MAEAVRRLRLIGRELRDLCASPAEELPGRAKELGAPLKLVRRASRCAGIPQ